MEIFANSHLKKHLNMAKKKKNEAKIGMIISVSLINYKCVLKP